MLRRFVRTSLAAGLCLGGVLATSPSRAELPSPRLDRIAPLGATAGTSIELEMQGPDLEEPKLLFDHPGITAEPLAGKERWFTVKVAADVPEGTYDVRISGKYGISNPRLFAVAKDLTDVAEKEPNNAIDQAQVINVGAAIAGTSDGNDQDVYRFTAAKGQRLSIDCLATRLDSDMDASMSVAAVGGAALASSGDYVGRDPFIDFLAPEAGEYLITVNDLSFRGGLPYRLVISDRPSVETVFPRAVQAGQTVELSVLGRNFGAGSRASAATLLDKPLDEIKFSVTGPDDVLRLGAFRFLEHPTQHSVLPSAATCTLTGWQIRPEASGRAVMNAVPMIVTDSPVTLEVEPNPKDTPQKVALPLVVSGRFDKPRDADWYEIDVPEDGNYSLDVYCERIAGQADPYVVIVDEKDMRVQEFDDFGHRTAAFDGHLRDPSATVPLSKKKYRVLVQDRYQRGGVRYQYVLSIRRAQPDFYVAAIHWQNPGPGGLTLWRGGAAHFDVITHFQGGFTGPLTLTAENLPPGVHATASTVAAGNNNAPFVLWADENAEPFTGPIKLMASATLPDGKQLIREIRPHARVWSQGEATSRPMRETLIAVRERAPFSLKFATDRLTVVAGQKVDAKLQLARLWPDSTEPLNVLALNWPGNFKMNNAQFAGGTAEMTLPIEVQAGTRPGEYTLGILGQGQVPFTKAADGKDKKNTLVSLPSQPVTITVVAAEK
jgi:hypothetical protein